MATQPPGSPVQQVVGSVAGRLRYPWLFALLVAALAADFVIPDPIPFIDELVLALLTVFVGSWRNRRQSQDPNSTPVPRD